MEKMKGQRWKAEEHTQIAHVEVQESGQEATSRARCLIDEKATLTYGI